MTDQPLTLVQYARRVRETFFAAEGPDAVVSRAEYDRLYPLWSRQQEWAYELEIMAKTGMTIPARVMDDLHKRGESGVIRSILRNHPAALPAGYLTPPVRALNRQHEAAWREARRRGREMAQDRKESTA